MDRVELLLTIYRQAREMALMAIDDATAAHYTARADRAGIQYYRAVRTRQMRQTKGE